MKIAFDHALLFRHVTGREMSEEDAAEFLRLRAHMPSGLADSPSFNFDLIYRYNGLLEFRKAISEAANYVAEDVQRQSKVAVAKLVDDSVKRIHASSPASSAAYYRGLWAAVAVMLFTSIVSTAAVYGALSTGTISPPWLSQQEAAKVLWADEVEARIGRGDVDWLMRKGKPDASLMAILHHLEERPGGSEAIRDRAQIKACQFPGAVAYRSAGKSYCKFRVVEPASSTGRRSERR
jgi:hypothetical protein